MPYLDTDAGRLAYERRGHGPAVLLVQGAGVVGNGWRPQVDALADRFDLITFDNRGIGGSDAGRSRLSIQAMAADALAIADREGLDAFHLAGHSMGGLIAQEVALTAPARVRSLALLCTFARGRQASALTLSMAVTALRCRVGTRRMRRRAFLSLVMPPAHLAACDRDALARELAPLFGRDLAEQPSIVMKQVAAMSRYDAMDRLRALSRIPTLVVTARHDRIARPEYGCMLAGAIPGARYIEIADAGHGVTIQRAAVINALLDEHWSGVP